MSSTETCQLTTKDYTILEAMLERHLGYDETMSAILHRKVSSALVVLAENIEGVRRVEDHRAMIEFPIVAI